jgi:hypothetical protein
MLAIICDEDDEKISLFSMARKRCPYNEFVISRRTTRKRRGTSARNLNFPPATRSFVAV